MVKIKAIRGVNDILPGEVEKWQYVEGIARQVLENYGFSEIRIPIFEETELFARSIGETSDIVEKEMYTFADRKGKKITLRPEGTASVVRAYIEHNLYSPLTLQKFYYLGPMFRYERPQKGRYRQFYQIGAEAFGVDKVVIDAEIIKMLDSLFNKLDVGDIKLQVNTLGCEQCRPKYREALKSYLKSRLTMLCDDCQRRFERNPLRVLDCKSVSCHEITINAPLLKGCICGGCLTHFEELQRYLSLYDVDFEINQRMVRGLDYYTRTTFEFVTDRLGAQNAVAAGGRYDKLVEEFGGPSVPAIGFAIGMERLISIVGDKDGISSGKPHLFIVALGQGAHQKAYELLPKIRSLGIRVETDYEDKSMKSQMRRADSLGVDYVIIIGDAELEKGKVIVRDMKSKEQDEVEINRILEVIRSKNI